MPVRKLTNRREFLKLTALGAAGAAVVTACAPATAPTPTPVPPTKPAEAPKPAAPTATPVPASTKPAATAAPAPTPTAATKPAEKVPSPGVVEIRFMNRGGKAAFDIHDQVVAAFTKATPNVKVKVEPVLEGAWDQKLLTAIASGTEPDTVMNGFGSWQAFAKRGQLLDISDYVKRDVKLDDFLPIANQSEIYKGKFYSWHYNGGPMALFYNKEAFDKDKIPHPDANWTWAKYWEVAKKLTIDRAGKRPGETGFDPRRVQQYGTLSLTGSWYIYVWQKGAEVFTKDKDRILLDDPKVLDTIQELADLVVKDGIWPNPLYPEVAPSDFVTGRVAMGLQGYWMVARAVPAKFAWDVAPMPKSEWVNKRVGFGYYSGNSVLKSTKHPEESWLLLRFFGGEPGQKIMGEGGLTYPAVLSVARDFKPKLPENVGAFLADYENMRFFEVNAYITELAKFNQLLNPELEKVWLGQAKAKDVLPPIVPKLNAIIAES